MKKEKIGKTIHLPTDLLRRLEKMAVTESVCFSVLVERMLVKVLRSWVK